jgi:hypothetical protein
MKRDPSISKDLMPKDRIICIHCGKEGEPFKKGRNVCKECRKKYRKKRPNNTSKEHKQNLRRAQDVRKILLRSARNRAIKKGLEFNLTIEDIVIPEYCPIFGTRIVLKRDTNHTNKSQKNYDGPSIDRLETNRGYVKGNIVICSWRANMFKGCMTFEQVEAWYLYLKNHRGA